MGKIPIVKIPPEQKAYKAKQLTKSHLVKNDLRGAPDETQRSTRETSEATDEVHRSILDDEGSDYNRGCTLQLRRSGIPDRRRDDAFSVGLGDV